MRVSLHVCTLSVLSLCSICIPPLQAQLVATLGDSYSSGVGIHPLIFGYDEIFGARENLDGRHYEFSTAQGCLREKTTTPGFRLAKDLGIHSEMIACGGARAQQLYDQIDYLNTLYPEERADNWAGSTFILTLGLNDLSSERGSWLTVNCNECVMGRSENDCSDNPDLKVNNQDEVKADIERALSYLAGEANQATIRVFGYGKLYQRQTAPGGDCDYAYGITNSEADFMDNEWFERINQISQDAIANIQTFTPIPGKFVDIEFIDVDAYLSVGACSKEGRHMNGFFALPPASFHPSQRGFDEYYRALVDNLAHS